MTNSTPGFDVVFSSDRSYVPHLATAVTSLLETNLSLVARVWVMTNARDSRPFLRFQEDVRKRYGLKPRALHVDEDRFRSVYVSGHVSWATYARFLLGELLPIDAQTVLYLDSDLVVVGPLDGILDRSGVASGDTRPIVRAVPRDSGHHLEEFGFRSDRYFNAGVLLVDLEQWRREGIQDQLFERAEQLFGKLHLWDQDVLNLVLEDKWSELPGHFNETALETKSADARIVHFVGGTKPWMVGGQHPYRDDYRRYRSLTPFWPYMPEGLGKYLRKRFLPRPLQRPKKTLRRIGRRIRRLVGAAITRR
jgi:lipopolysaccharide biosynthesis glycosyltransferase